MPTDDTPTPGCNPSVLSLVGDRHPVTGSADSRRGRVDAIDQSNRA
jgi:hypothetical protein